MGIDGIKKIKFLTIKDICLIVGCGVNVAVQIRKDIAKEYKISVKRVTIEHLNKYFSIDF